VEIQPTTVHKVVEPELLVDTQAVEVLSAGVQLEARVLVEVQLEVMAVGDS
jgi:hypothetical protein